MQRAYLMELTALAEEDKNVLVLIADNGTDFDGTFKAEFSAQFFDFGIAEENLVAAAAGLASCGKVPFVYTAGAFLAYRSYEFIRDDVCLQNQNVKLVGNGAGLSISTLGPTHHATEDISALRALPNLTLLCPASPREARKAMRAAYETPGPVYIRLGMGGEAEIYTEDYVFEVGKAVTLREGNDLTLIATGSIAAEVLAAADSLAKEGIAARVLNMHTLKPFDTKAVLQAAQETGALFTVEEHNVQGGLGSLVAEVLAGAGAGVRLHRMGLADRFAQGYGTQQVVRRLNGLDADAICARVRTVLG